MILGLLLACSIQQPGGGALVPEWRVPSGGARNEAEILPVPDLDGDARDDWVVRFPSDGVLTLLSGASGDQVWEQTAVSAKLARLIDLEGDGRFELVVGSEGRFLQCFDAHSGDVLWEAVGNWTERFAALQLHFQDIDSDGTLEILASDAAGGERATVINSACFRADGSLVWSESIGVRDNYYSAMHFVDLNQDGLLDLVHGDPRFWETSGPVNEGVIRAIDGATGAQMWEARGNRTQGLLGSNIDVIDLNGDGNPEVLSRSPGAEVAGLTGAGRVVALDGMTGQVNWTVEGMAASDRLGEVSACGDLDANGSIDLVLGMPNALSGNGQVRAIDGASGAELWSAQDWPRSGDRLGRGLKVWHDPSSGISYVVIEARLNASALVMELRGFDFRAGRTGQRVAAQLLEIEAPYGIDFELVDLDQDSLPEVVFSQSQVGGVIGAVDESAGLLWKRVETGVGKHRFLHWNQRTARWMVVTQTPFARNGVTNAGKVMGLNATTGDAVWEFAGTRAQALMGYELELMHDEQLGQDRILASARADLGQGQLGETYVLDPRSGEAVVSFRDTETLGGFRYPVLARAVDSDADGKRELLVVVKGEWKQYPAMPVRRELLSIAGGAISVSQGGTAELQLDFGTPCAWYEYEVLVGAHGVGRATETALDIPLRRDRLLGLSLERKIPGGMMPRSFGVLDAYGKESVELRIAPGQFPVAAVGRSLHFCVQARKPWSSWEYCSVPVELRFIP